MSTHRILQAIELMNGFAERTGLSEGVPPRRYLWTDAFAVCNYVGLAEETRDPKYTDLALRLVFQVHHTLGRHRADDSRKGWISGLSEAEGEAHPTKGGLRIGKTFQERASLEPTDPAKEWERDGQYFHYLTKWAHALDQVSRWTGRAPFHVWGRELLQAAADAFTYGRPERSRMAWKMSIDLSRPLVPSMGQHDPIDGLVTCVELDATADRLGLAREPNLGAAAADFARMIHESGLVTGDPLGVGELLVLVHRLAQLPPLNHRLIDSLLRAALTGLAGYGAGFDPRASAESRLAFRELGLAIGLAAVTKLRAGSTINQLGDRARGTVNSVAEYMWMRSDIESFWLRPESRRSTAWGDHADINDVMLATSLAAEGFLTLLPRGSRRAPEAGNAPAPAGMTP